MDALRFCSSLVVIAYVWIFWAIIN